MAEVNGAGGFPSQPTGPEFKGSVSLDGKKFQICIFINVEPKLSISCYEDHRQQASDIFNSVCDLSPVEITDAFSYHRVLVADIKLLFKLITTLELLVVGKSVSRSC